MAKSSKVRGYSEEDSLKSEKKQAIKAMNELWVTKHPADRKKMAKLIEDAENSRQISMLMKEVRDKI
jgi:hypothetical protein